MAASGHKVVVTPPTQADIGKWLARARKAKDLVQQEAATAIGVDKQTVSDWETGRYRMTAEDFLKLVLLYEADVLELLARKYDPTSRSSGTQASHGDSGGQGGNRKLG